MITIKKNLSLSHYYPILGGDYSLFDKIKLLGTGSAKTVFINGIKVLEKELTNQSLKYSSFQLFPKALLIRNLKQNETIEIILEKDKLDQIDFVSRRIQVTVKGRKYIVHDSKIQFILVNNERINFYSPTTFYKPISSFFQKDWLNSITNFTIDPRPPIIDKGGGLVGTLMHGF